MANRCQFRKKDGERCGANAQANSGLCVFHDPARAADGQRARRAGGINRSRRITALPPETADVPLRSVPDVCSLLVDTINQVRRGQLDVRVAKTLGYLANTLLGAMQQGPLDERLAAVEAALGLGPPGSNHSAKGDG